MHAFAELLERLALTPSRTGKSALLRSYFSHTPDPCRGYALAAIAGTLSLPSLGPARIRALAEARVDPQLFRLSYDYVGDLAETISLIWPQSMERIANARPPRLSEAAVALAQASRQEAETLTALWLDRLEPPARFALIKLASGGLRVGVSARFVRQALAEWSGQPLEEIEDIWHGQQPPYGDLFAWLEGRAQKPAAGQAARFRPAMLAHPLLDREDTLADAPDLSPESHAAEWKWDGVRVQIACEAGETRLFTRTGEDISAAFPDLTSGIRGRFAMDGELLVRTVDGATGSFSDLQKRLNRKRPDPALMRSNPAFILAYDLLMENDEDLRRRPFRERRARLERLLVEPQDAVRLSELVAFASLAELDLKRSNPPLAHIEGIMLKAWDSPYIAGRPAGLWYKWKRDPYVIDAVLMYAQRGHGRRSGAYSDYTFGVWNRGSDGERSLAVVGKAYSGFSDAELKRIDAFVKANTRERFGPVRSVTATENAGLVLEIAFDGLSLSTRHKSGVAMRFPRIRRIRWDKPPAEADTLDTLRHLIR